MEKFKVLSKEEMDKMSRGEVIVYSERLLEYIESLINSNSCKLEIFSILMSSLMTLLEYDYASTHQGGDDDATLASLNIIKSIIEDNVQGDITIRNF